MKTCLHLLLFSAAISLFEDNYLCQCEDQSDASDDTPFMIFTTAKEIRKTALDGKFNDSTLLRRTITSRYVDFLYKERMLFWSEYEDGKILKASLDDQNTITTVIKGANKLEYFAVDWIYNNLYWVLKHRGTVEVSNLDGKMRQVLIDSNLENSLGIALDPTSGWMFLPVGAKISTIEKAAMDGSERQIILQDSVMWPIGLTLDLDKKQLYWADEGKPILSTCDYDGSNRRVILRSKESLTEAWSMDIFKNYLYWTERKTLSIYKASLTGGDLQRLIHMESCEERPRGTRVYHKRKQLDGENPCPSANCPWLCVAAPNLNLPNSPNCSCIPQKAEEVTPKDNSLPKCDVTDQPDETSFLLYSSTIEIRKIPLGCYSDTSTVLENTLSARDVDFLYKKRMIVWSEHKGCAVHKASLDDLKTTSILVEDAAPCRMQDLAVDWIYNNLYFVIQLKGTIEVSNLDGKMRQVLIEGDMTHPLGIALDPLIGWMFWTVNEGPFKIEKAGMDGSERTIILEKDITWPNALTLDLKKKQLYWVDREEATISSCDYNGNNRREILHSTKVLANSYGIDIYGNWLYWTERSTFSIFRCNLTGGQVQSMYNLENWKHRPHGIRVYNKKKQPRGKNYCKSANCPHLCVAAPKLNKTSPKFSCISPKNDKDAEKENSLPKCNVTDQPDETSFMIFSSTKEIRKIPLDCYSDTSTVLVPTISSRDVNFLYKTRIIVWSEHDGCTIYKASLDDLATTFKLVEDAVPCRMQYFAVDWIYNNLYFVIQQKGNIEVSDLDGKMRQVLIEGDMTHPSGIALDPLIGWMFWTVNEGPFKIEKAGMDGSERTIILEKDLKWPNSLTLDLENQQLYWVDEKEATISSCDYNGNNRREILHLTKVLTNSYSIDVFGDWLYWTENSTFSIFRANLTGGEVQTMYKLETWQHRPQGFRLYNKKKQPDGKNYCKSAKCPHLCVAAPKLNDTSPKFSCISPKTDEGAPESAEKDEQDKDRLSPKNDKDDQKGKHNKDRLSPKNDKDDQKDEQDKDRLSPKNDKDDQKGKHNKDRLSPKNDKDDQKGKHNKDRLSPKNDKDDQKGKHNKDRLFPKNDKDDQKGKHNKDRLSPKNDNDDQKENPKCGDQPDTSFLLFSSTKEIRKLPLGCYSDPSTVLEKTVSSRGVNFLYKKKMIFWSEHERCTIYKASLDDLKITSMLVEDAVPCHMQDLAVDWIHNNLYFVIQRKGTIEVSNLDGKMRHVLIEGDMTHPLGIALDPLIGWMFWTVNEGPFKIEKAGMDGSERKIILEKDLKWPNGLTLDLDKKQLYWVDRDDAKISSCDYNGNNQREILYSTKVLINSYGIDVFKNWLYWTERSTYSIVRGNLTGGKVQSIYNLENWQHRPHGIRVYHKKKQPHGKNHCKSANCPHLCVTAPKLNDTSPKFSCISPKNEAWIGESAEKSKEKENNGDLEVEIDTLKLLLSRSEKKNEELEAKLKFLQSHPDSNLACSEKAGNVESGESKGKKGEEDMEKCKTEIKHLKLRLSTLKEKLEEKDVDVTTNTKTSHTFHIINIKAKCTGNCVAKIKKLKLCLLGSHIKVNLKKG